MNNESTDVFKMKKSSTDILCRLIAITSKFEHTDQQIQSIEPSNESWEEELLATSVGIAQVKELLSTCRDELEILEIIHTRCLSQDKRMYIEQEKNVQNENVLFTVKSVECTDMMAESREYFGVRIGLEDNENDEENVDDKNSLKDWRDEFNSDDTNITRLSFAPVLRQLKHKIDPIKAEMKERELKFLMSKGIDRGRIIEFDQNDDSQNGVFAQRNNKRTNLHDRYTETRSFLQQKHTLFLPLANLPLPSNSEEIIE